ncbi:hypothetical protein [Chitinophaga nivalis]|uniref:Lasso RiPP family leader peptide-containing protein n=1 Tax=Chitinophaga nivalis TaxID=2991709 RepID=A0ABT3INL4_9BACT|nr:hypothetical protein [Chitinophaga nivalis]MCW3464754.1 hypothetical protein [Chitinophaga nivalis]MCW3485555.1 hypothetical protein [Chitinophaga nivalis]
MRKKNNTHKKLLLKKGIITLLTQNDTARAYGGGESNTGPIPGAPHPRPYKPRFDNDETL